MNFGDRIKIRREELGLTRSELAQKLGVTSSAIGNYENGISSPKEEILLSLFDALEVDANYLFQDAIKNSPTSKDAGEQEIMESAQKIYQALLSAGYIKEGQELTPAQIDFLDGLSAIISAFFNK